MKSWRDRTMVAKSKFERPRLQSPASFPAASSILGALLILLVVFPAPASGQLTADARLRPGVVPRAYLDCQGPLVPCNFNVYRTEVQFVDWVRDAADADVHILFTGEETSGGGSQLTLTFIGQGDLAHLSDELTYMAHGTDILRETRDGITRLLRLGLTRFAVERRLVRNVELDLTHGIARVDDGRDPVPPVEDAAVYDPWNYWIFSVGFSGDMAVQELRSNYLLNPSVSADRVTQDWKLSFNVAASMRWEGITLANDREVRNDAVLWHVTTLAVKSITPHVSAGVDFRSASSVEDNQRARVSLTPALEWNYYPYGEFGTRQLIAQYGVGVEYSNYELETIFGVNEETLPIHRVGVYYRAVAPWGNAGLGINAAQYLHQGGLYSFGATGNVSFRVVRGLELSLTASGSRVADQIHIAAEDIPEEEILLGRRALPTGFAYAASIGFNYRWGSMFTNVVNIRFPPSLRLGGGGA